VGDLEGDDENKQQEMCYKTLKVNVACRTWDDPMSCCWSGGAGIYNYYYSEKSSQVTHYSGSSG
jgi:hypothetical protein